MEARKQTYISILALIVSVVSLVTTYYLEYRENLEVIGENIEIVSTDFDNSLVECKAEVIVANLSRHTVPLTKLQLYKIHSGFKDAERIHEYFCPDLPLTLVSGGVERVTITFQYKLSSDEMKDIKNKAELLEYFDGRTMSIRFNTAKTKTYSTNMKFSTAS
ncbi:MAG: hypothetical protein E7588_06420 [Ruminococcaceae bacterium]|nr:hypothetical protein [Oscillospiraceae bacterium]